MIFLDNETTGLIKAGIEDPTVQPRIIELGCIITDSAGNELSRYSTLVNPEVTLDPVVMKITGLTDADLVRAPVFPSIVRELARVFRSDPDQTLVCHNVPFDHGCLVFELQRIGWEFRFPWPTEHIDTVPLSGGKKLSHWAQEVLPADYAPQVHRAIADAQMMLDCWKTLT